MKQLSKAPTPKQISAAVITASDFAQLMFGEEALDDLKATLEMQRGKKMPKIGS